jgi:hypothetical protein
MSLATLGLLCLASLPQDPALPVQSQAPWADVFNRLKFYGDFRLRLEESFKLDDKKDRDRQRLRLRFGVNYQVTDELLLGTRIVTGDKDDPKSTHVTFGRGFDDIEMNLDRAFLTYRPAWWENSYATAGKFNNPLYRNPVFGELVWDTDVQPEGAVTGHSIQDVAGFEELGLTLAAYRVLEQGDADDANMVVGELKARFPLGAQGNATLASSYTYYGETTPDGSSALLDNNAGNAVADTTGDGAPDEFVSDFGIWHTVLGTRYSGWKTPVTFAGEYIKNTRADIDADEGWALGLSLGSAAKKGDWRTYYQWQVIEQDAVFSAFAQDDFLFSTNHRSHLFGVNYQLTDKIGLHLWGLVSARDKTFNTPTTDSDSEQWRVRLDLNVKL